MHSRGRLPRREASRAGVIASQADFSAFAISSNFTLHKDTNGEANRGRRRQTHEGLQVRGGRGRALDGGTGSTGRARWLDALAVRVSHAHAHAAAEADDRRASRRRACRGSGGAAHHTAHGEADERGDEAQVENFGRVRANVGPGAARTKQNHRGEPSRKCPIRELEHRVFDARVPGLRHL